MYNSLWLRLLIFWLLFGASYSACYDGQGNPLPCITFPKNAALNKKVIASNTCGNPAAGYCELGPERTCKICDQNSPTNRHPASFIVDGFNPLNVTWWQSQNWWETNQNGLSQLYFPLKVNVTISFDKKYFISGGVYVTFKSERPKQMIIEHSQDFGKTFKPYQYYAKNCLTAYNMVADPPPDPNNPFKVICSQLYSGEFPRSGGMVVFNRAGIYNPLQYLNHDVHKSMDSTDIRLRLEYPGTDGREYIDSEATLNQYYYAISNVRIDARCNCHGHGEFCDFINGIEMCDCQHFTTGQDCQFCLPLYNNREWMEANETHANACQKCDCHDHANSCVYSAVLGYGICQNCDHNTTGIKCDQCVDRYFRNMILPLNDINVCQPCNCFLPGVIDDGNCLKAASLTQQIGQCFCKTGVYGRRCDQCVPGRWGFSLIPEGECFDCACNFFGTLNGNQTCDQYNGQCLCKPNIMGRKCDTCKSGYYLFPNSVAGDCLKCVCDEGGGFPLCDKITGNCNCRYGITGMRCDSVMAGHFFPNFTFNIAEPELLLTSGTFMNYYKKVGYETEFSGIGYVRLVPETFMALQIKIPVSGNYFIAVRYTLYPSVFYEMINRYGRHSANWTGSSRIVDHININDRPLFWQFTLTLTDSAGQFIKAAAFSIADLEVGEAHAWLSTISASLDSTEAYTVSLTYLNTANSYGTPWPILIDTVILMPDYTTLPYYQGALSKRSATQQEIINCFNWQSALSRQNEITSVCRRHVFVSTLQFYNRTFLCNCDTIGSLNDICEVYGGQCPCQIGYGGRRCHHCQPGYHGTPSISCTDCMCSFAGSVSLACNQQTAACSCRINTMSQRCGQCKPRTFDLDATNPCGCQECYGYGHMTSCNSASSFVRSYITTNFTADGFDGWSLREPNGSNSSSNLLRITGFGIDYFDEAQLNIGRYLKAPDKFIGRQLISYNQLLRLQIRFFTVTNTMFQTPWHVLLAGGGYTAEFYLSPPPDRNVTMYHVRLNEKFMVNSSKLTTFQFKSLLGQLSAIHIRPALFTSISIVTFQSIILETAVYDLFASSHLWVRHVENSTCLTPYTGLSCESCAPGFTRLLPNGGPLTICVPCQCNNRSNDCHPETGICRNCQAGTKGDHCELCLPFVDAPACDTCMAGYWGLTSTSNGCQPCNCYLPGTIDGSNNICDVTTGQCQCNTTINVGGRRCNTCKENAYNVSLGVLRCQECPPCYGLIETEVVFLRHSMSLLQIEIHRLALQASSSDPMTPFYQFLATTNSIVANFTIKANEAARRVSSLDILWKELGNSIRHFQSTVNGTTNQALMAAINATNSVIDIYNSGMMSVANVDAFVTNSFILLNVTSASRLTQQQSALSQLQSLSNELDSYVSAARRSANEVDAKRNELVNHITVSLATATAAVNMSMTARTLAFGLNRMLSPLHSLTEAVRVNGYALSVDSQEWYRNASMALIYAKAVLGNITLVLPDYRAEITRLNDITTSLILQSNTINERVASAQRGNNAIAQQISLIKQQGLILDSQVSTVERRALFVAQTSTNALQRSQAALDTGLATRTEALDMLNTVTNFNTVAEQAALDSAKALTAVDDVQTTVTQLLNTAQGVGLQLQLPTQNLNNANLASQEAHRLTMVEKELVDGILSRALALQNETSNAISLVQRDQVQQYVDTNVTPYLNECFNFTTDITQLRLESQTTLASANVALNSAATSATSLQRLGNGIRSLPVIDTTLLTSLQSDISSTRFNFSALNLNSGLHSLRNAVNVNRGRIEAFKLRVSALKIVIERHHVLYASTIDRSCAPKAVAP